MTSDWPKATALRRPCQTVCLAPWRGGNEKTTFRKVCELAGFGLSTADIAKVFDIGAEDVGTRFAKGLGSGQIKANARVAERLCRKATAGGRKPSPPRSSG